MVAGPQGDLARGMEGWAGGSQGVSEGSQKKVPHHGWLLLPKGSLTPRAGGSPDAPLLIKVAQQPPPALSGAVGLAHSKGQPSKTQVQNVSHAGPRETPGELMVCEGPSLSLLRPRSVPPGPLFSGCLAGCFPDGLAGLGGPHIGPVLTRVSRLA